MFFKLAIRNSAGSRKENGLFFVSLFITIIAFYIILSLPRQDVMLFLKKMESDAVNRLFSMIPLFFGAALFILFFLVYYAGKYQMERRRHEFGLYLMMGMRRGRLLLLLLAEDFYSSLLSLAAGLPAAVLVAELTSLITARIAGMDVVGHRFSFSPAAAAAATAGFLAVKFAVFLILSGKVARQEVLGLLGDLPEGAKKEYPLKIYEAAGGAGILCLAAAWGMAVSGFSWNSLYGMAAAIVLGLAGTWLLFFGLRSVMRFFAKRGRKGGKLRVFHFRQLEETVNRCYSILAVCSLLILTALCSFGTGIAVMWCYGSPQPHVLDYTFAGDRQDASEAEKILSESGLDREFSFLSEMKIGYIETAEDYDHAYRMNPLTEALSEIEDAETGQRLANILTDYNYPHIISLDSYNYLLTEAGLPELLLEKGQAGIYMDSEVLGEKGKKAVDAVLKTQPSAEIDGTIYRLKGDVQSVNLVTDRSITLYFALILPDEDFEYYTQGEYTVYLNGILKKGGGESLMNVIMDMNKKLDKTGILYESYLQNMGRQMFYSAAAGYITIYLAVVFLIIGNTMIGVQFLMAQRKSGRRYSVLSRLGASYKDLCRVMDRQVRWYFGIPAAAACVSSLFGARALMAGIVPSVIRSSTGKMMWISAIMILVLCVIECAYVEAVRRSCDRYLLTVTEPEREE